MSEQDPVASPQGRDFVEDELSKLKAEGYPVQPVACPWCLSRGLECRHPKLASPQGRAEALVEGVYMDRSIADFQRSCAVHIAEEQRRISPDTALIALLCDAVRCSRELALELARAGERGGE